jgi:hypothetical protein
MRYALIAGFLLSACGLPQAERNVDYESMFVHDRLVEWKISIDDDDWHELLLSPSVYVPADVEVDGESFHDVGVRLVGNLNRSKIGMRVRFNEFNLAHRYFGVKRVNLRNAAADPTLVREALALHLMRSAGVPAPRSSFVWIDWGSGGGVYTLVEQVDRRFLDDRFGENDGNLYRVETGGNLVYRGDDPAGYDWMYTYELRTNEEQADYSDLINLMKVLDRGSGAEDLERVLDVDGFLLALVVDTWLANMDSYAGSGRNYYLYHDVTGRFRYIPWDLNRAFGNYNGRYCTSADGEENCMLFGAEICLEFPPQDRETCGEQIAELCAEHPREMCFPEFWDIYPVACQDPPPGCDTCGYTADDLLALDPEQPTCNPDRPLVRKVLEVPEFRRCYQEHLRTLIDGVLAPAEVESWMETMRILISGHADQDAWKDFAYDEDGVVLDYGAAFYTDTKTGLQDDWKYRVPGLLPFIQARDQMIRGGLGGSSE